MKLLYLKQSLLYFTCTTSFYVFPLVVSKTTTNIEEMAVVISKSKSELYALPNSFNRTF